MPPPAETAAPLRPHDAAATTGGALLDRTNRTFICSVLFLDIVEYSRKPVSEQILLKERFNSLISDSIDELPPNDRIILDTGDGAAINFLGDSEDALFVAVALRDAFRRPVASGLRLEARMGLNLGPVRLVKDLNGQPNIIGDGINVAQRVMSFAEPGQVLVSRSYFEVVSHLSAGYSQMFSYRGSRTDKHVREHEVWEVAATMDADSAVRPRRPGRREAAATPAVAVAPAAHAWWRNPHLAYAASAFSVVLLATAVVLSRDRPETGGAKDAPLVAAASVPAPAQLPTVSPPETVVVHRMLDIEELMPEPVGPPSGGAKRNRGDPARRSAAPAEPQRTAKLDRPSDAAPAASTVASQPAEPAAAPLEKAIIALAVSPWGEIYVNGTRLGVTPPVNVVEVNPGRVEVEIRNSGFPSHFATLELTPGQQVRVKHKF
jgi:class 3 adenylate cyclase